MSIISVRSTWLRRLLLIGGILFCMAAFLRLRPQMASAQSQVTVTLTAPIIVVREPDLTPPYRDDAYPDGWLKLAPEKSGISYLAPNLMESTGEELSGEWRPQVDQSGYYLVEVYLGIGELREYRLSPAAQERSLPELSESAGYLIRHANGETLVNLDQGRQNSGWFELGGFFFDAGDQGVIVLNNVTGEPDGSRLVAFSALRLTQLTAPTAIPTVTASPPAPTSPTATVGPTPIPSDTPTTAPPATATEMAPATATVPPSPTAASAAAELPQLEFGTTSSTTVDGVVSEEREISLDGTPVGRLGLSYPLEMQRGQRKNIIVDLEVTGVFTSTLVRVINRTLDQPLEVDAFEISPIFEVALKGPFDFTELNERPAKRMEVPQAETSWNVEPQAEALPGEAELSIEVSVLSNFAPDEFVPRRVIPFSTKLQTAGGGPPAWLWWLLGLLFLLLMALIWYWLRRRSGQARLLAPPSWSDLDKGLLAILRQRFLDEAEFADLCFQLDQPYADLAGQTLSARMRDLVQRLERQGRLPQLLTAMDEAEALDHLEWRPIQTPLLRLLAARLGDEQFRSRFAPDFSDAAFANQVRSLAQRLAEDETRSPRLLALITNERAAASDEERQLIRGLQEHTQGADGEVNVPQLVAAMAAAERS